MQTVIKARFPMQALLITAGTDGDVIPYVALGTVLNARGHHVTLIANESYGPTADKLGLHFRTLVDTNELDQLLSNRDVWHPLKSALIGARWGTQIVERSYKLIADYLTDHGDNCVIVASPAILAARLIQEKRRIPTASVALQPWMIPSVSAPPVMPAGLSLPAWAPRPFGHLYWRTVDAVGDVLITRHLNDFRRTIDLPPIKRIFQWWISPDLTIGMFPETYATPQDDWPDSLRLAGFPLSDGQADQSLPAEVDEFLHNGDPPIALTFGTGMMHARPIFETAIAACQRLGKRAILLTKHSDQLPDPLPSFVRHFRFAPFRALFPHCAAVVHHGGVGTTGKCLAAGTPQLIIPFAFDQKDNATRVKQMRVGDWLKKNRCTTDSLTNMLGALTSREFQHRCQQSAGRFSDTSALDTAATWIEQLRAEYSPQT